jgi:hypothetical protein
MRSRATDLRRRERHAAQEREAEGRPDDPAAARRARRAPAPARRPRALSGRRAAGGEVVARVAARPRGAPRGAPTERADPHPPAHVLLADRCVGQARRWRRCGGGRDGRGEGEGRQLVRKRPHGDSNSGSSLERAVSWASRRWGRRRLIPRLKAPVKRRVRRTRAPGAPGPSRARRLSAPAARGRARHLRKQGTGRRTGCLARDPRAAASR